MDFFRFKFVNKLSQPGCLSHLLSMVVQSDAVLLPDEMVNGASVLFRISMYMVRGHDAAHNEFHLGMA